MSQRGLAFGLKLAKADPRAFSVPAALASAYQTLSLPPTRSTVRREPPNGALVYRFALPLSMCKTTNSTRHGSPWSLGKTKSECMMLMHAQLPRKPYSVLPGRPQIRCVRFTSKRPDRYSDWAKIPVDCLVKLGVIRNDDEESIDLFQWSEPGGRGIGCVLIEVWSGEAESE